MVSEGVW